MGEEYAGILTQTIGLLELGMVVWIMSGIKPRVCAITQIVVVGVMVSIEIILTPDLLLFGRANTIPAIIFIALVYYHAFISDILHQNKPAAKLSAF